MEDLEIEVNVSYDCGLASWWFDENFHRLGDGLYQYVDNGNFKEIELWDLCTIDRNKTLKKSLLNYALSICSDYSKIEIRKMTKDELADLIENDMNETDSDLDKWLEFAVDNNISIGADDFIKIETCGYSQGDYTEVWVNKKDYKEIIGVELDECSLKKQIDRLFWGTPISYSLTINGEDYYINEHVSNMYEYDRDETYRICEELFKNHKEIEYILGYIKGSLPEYPESYN